MEWKRKKYGRKIWVENIQNTTRSTLDSGLTC
jgi:hypothetical protein